MKRALPWVIGLGCTGAVVVFLIGQNKPSGTAIAEPTSKQVAPAQPAQPAPAAAAEKIVYTFDSDEKVKEFETLWRQRQAAIVRMSVLQAYWNDEQNGLTQLNSKLTTDYTVDIQKNYALDPQRRVLIEREDLPPPAAAPAAPAAQPGSSATATQ